MEDRFTHPSNANLPILVTELGMVTEVSAVQHTNAASPMLDTELRVIEVSLSHSSHL